MTEYVLRAERLGKSYTGAGPGVRAVDDIDLAVRTGEFVGIMGSSGSGKTTLLYLLAGLERPSNGSVWVNERPIDQLAEKDLARLRRDSIGFVFQSMNLLPHLSLRENILVAGYLTNRRRGEVNLTTDRLLQEMGIVDAAHRLPAEVSVGQQQRAAIGRALVNSPRLVFADEPTGSLNSATSAGVLDLLEAVNRSGTTVVMVTHDLKAACRGGRVLFLRDGRVEGQFAFDGDDRLSPDDSEKRLCAWLFEKGW
jgi:putative ABC transport system ATP-binding protein